MDLIDYKSRRNRIGYSSLWSALSLKIIFLGAALNILLVTALYLSTQSTLNKYISVTEANTRLANIAHK